MATDLNKLYTTNQIILQNIGGYKKIAIKPPLITSLFYRNNGTMYNSWCFFADNYSESLRNEMLLAYTSAKCNSLIFLLSNANDDGPINFFKSGFAKDINYTKLLLLESYVKRIFELGGYPIPVFFCDDGENIKYHNLSDTEYERFFGVLTTILRPYCPAFVIGIESSEYFDKDRHNYFINLIKRFAPDRFVGIHTQKIPNGGMPNVDFVLYEHSWNPNDGDNHSKEEVLQEVVDFSRKVADIYKPTYIWPIEFNTNITGSKIIEQSVYLLKNGYSSVAYF